MAQDLADAQAAADDALEKAALKLSASEGDRALLEGALREAELELARTQVIVHVCARVCASR